MNVVNTIKHQCYSAFRELFVVPVSDINGKFKSVYKAEMKERVLKLPLFLRSKEVSERKDMSKVTKHVNMNIVISSFCSHNFSVMNKSTTREFCFQYDSSKDYSYKLDKQKQSSKVNRN